MKIKNVKTGEIKDFYGNLTDVPNDWAPYNEPSTPAAPVSVTPDVNEAFIREQYANIVGREPSIKEVNAWMVWGAANPDQFNKGIFPQVFRAAAQTEISGYEPEAETAYEEPEDLKAYRESINAQIAEGMPELTPEMVAQWQPYLQEMSAPFEREAVTGLREEYNLASPYSIGSGKQMKATSDMMTKFAANKMATALSLGQVDYGKKWDAYQAGLSRQGALAGITNENEWREIQRKWAEEDAAKERTYALQDYESQKDFATNLANMYQPKEKEWWEYILEPVATGAGYAFGGPLGAYGGKKLSDWITGG